MEYATKGMTQIYSSMAVALSAEYGVLKNGLGPAWIDGLPYWCDGSAFIAIPSDGVAENAGVDYAVKGMTQIYSSMALALSEEYGAEKNGRGPVWIAGLPYWCDGVGFISISVAGVPAIIPGLEYAVRGMTQIYSSMAVAISNEYGANRHGTGPAWIGGQLFWSDGSSFSALVSGGVQAPNFTTPFDILDGPVGTSYNINGAILNTGGPIDTFALDGTLPAGLSLNPTTGFITGTTTSEGVYSNYGLSGENAAGSDSTNLDSMTVGAALPNIVDPSFLVTRSSTESVNKPAELDVIISPSDLTKHGNSGIVFDAITLSNLGYRPKDRYSFTWDLGRPGSTFRNISVDHPYGNDANKAMGTVVSHVYPEGTYTVHLYVKEHSTGKIGYDEITFTIPSEDSFYPTTQTIYVSPSSDFSQATVVGASQVTTWAAAKALTEGVNEGKRILFNKGEIHDIEDFLDIRRIGDYCIGAFGVGADPVWNVLPFGGHVDNNHIIYIRDISSPSRVVVRDINAIGNYDPITGTGETLAVVMVNQLAGSHVTVHHCRMRGLREMHNIGSHHEGGNVTQDNDVSDWYNFAHYGYYSLSVCRGNSMKQNPAAVTGFGGKDTSSYKVVGDGVTTTYAHGYNMDGDTAKNLFVGKIDDSTNPPTITEFTVGTDFTNTNPPAGDTSGTVTYIVPLISTERTYIYPRHWAEHGPIRTPENVRGSIIHNAMASYTGWSAAGAPAGEGAIQPCIRNHSNATDGGESDINMNHCIGGITPIHTGGANGDLDYNGTCEILIEQNWVECDSHSWAGIAAQSAGTTVRNNFILMPDLMESTIYRQVDSPVLVGTWPSAPAAAKALPCRVYGNTFVNLQSTANGAANLLLGSDPLGMVSIPPEMEAMTDLAFGENIVYFPDSPTAVIADYSPINEVTGELLAGNAGLDSGTPNDLLWDDSQGRVRDGSPSVGAHDLVGAPAVTAQVLTLNASSSKITLPARTYIAGEKIKLRFKSTGNTTYSTLINRGSLRFYSSSRLRYSDVPVMLIDGVHRASSSTNSEVEDGAWHDLSAELGSDSGAGYVMVIGSQGSSEYWGGEIEQLQITDASDNVLFEWALTSGLAVEPASIGAGDAVITDGVWS